MATGTLLAVAFLAAMVAASVLMHSGLDLRACWTRPTLGAGWAYVHRIGRTLALRLGRLSVHIITNRGASR